MKLTNKFNLPEPIVQALSDDDYVRGDADYTTTQLNRPVWQDLLIKKHHDELEEDVSDRAWAFIGQVKHAVLQRIAEKNPERYLVEERFSVVTPGGIKISGKIDLYDFATKILYDWKENSVWKFMLGETIDWERQGNVNAFLMRMSQMEVSQLVNITWLRDWKKRLARTTRREDYPQCAIHVIPLPMWSIGQQQDYILNRIKDYKNPDPTVCSFKERWQRPHQFALMKKGRKSAIKLYSNEDEANGAMRKKQEEGGNRDLYIEERPTEPVRCLDFCSVVQYCEFGRKALEEWKS